MLLFLQLIQATALPLISVPHSLQNFLAIIYLPTLEGDLSRYFWWNSFVNCKIILFVLMVRFPFAISPVLPVSSPQFVQTSVFGVLNQAVVCTVLRHTSRKQRQRRVLCWLYVCFACTKCHQQVCSGIDTAGYGFVCTAPLHHHGCDGLFSFGWLGQVDWVAMAWGMHCPSGRAPSAKNRFAFASTSSPKRTA